MQVACVPHCALLKSTSNAVHDTGTTLGLTQNSIHDVLFASGLQQLERLVSKFCDDFLNMNIEVVNSGCRGAICIQFKVTRPCSRLRTETCDDTSQSSNAGARI